MTATAPASNSPGHQAGVFLVGALAITLVFLAVTGQINNYLQPAFRPFILLTGLLLGVLALWSARRKVPYSPLRETSWLLMVPVLVLGMSAPAALGGSSVANHSFVRVDNASVDAMELLPLQPQGINPMDMEELTLRFMRSDATTLAGHRVSVEGFAHHTSDGQWHLSRYKIYCCAADAMAYTATFVEPTPEQLALLEDDHWYRISAVVVLEEPGYSSQFPLLRVEHMEPIEQPQEPYL